MDMQGLVFKNPMDTLMAQATTTNSMDSAISRIPKNSDIEGLSQQLNRIEKKMEEGFAAIMTQKSTAIPDLPGLFKPKSGGSRRRSSARKSRKSRSKK